jgi:ribonuclease HI
MKQLSFFNQENSDSLSLTPKAITQWILYIDGASRNNPGLAGAGICLMQNEKIICEQGFFLGVKTNNQAEYLALLLGLFFASSYAKLGDHVRIVSDSQLLVRQMQGGYKVKDIILLELKRIAIDLMKPFHIEFVHVLRSENKKADELANYGIDKKISPPKRFSDLLSTFHCTTITF